MNQFNIDNSFVIIPSPEQSQQLDESSNLIINEKNKNYNKFQNMILFILKTIFYVYYGVIIRHLLSQNIFKFQNFTKYLLTNLIGCFLYSFLDNFIEFNIFDLLIFKSAFLGSLTTYSSFINTELNNNIKDYLYFCLIEYSIYWSIFKLGNHLSEINKKIKIIKSIITIKFNFIIFGILLVISFLYTTNLQYSFIFCYFGFLIRYFISKLNIFNKYIKYGTLICNTSGILILLITEKYLKNQEIKFGIIEGFCGCLTTMSTFVYETNNIKEVGIYYLLLTIYISYLFFDFIT